MPLEFVKSQKGKDLLLLRGHLFVEERRTNETTTWKCTFYKKIKCSARAKTNALEVIEEPEHDHTHAPDLALAKAKKIVSELKERAADVQETTKQIVAGATTNISQ